MKKINLLFFPILLVAILLSFNNSNADYPKGAPFIGSFFDADSSGGPDSLGYTWRDTILTAGTLGFLDTTWGSGTWTRVTGLGDDNLVGPYNLGWSFRYYYYNVNQVWIGSNGWISFTNPGSSQLASPFPNIPASTPPNNLIVPYGSDLNFQGTGNIGRVYFYSNNVDTFIVSFYNVPFWQQAAPSWVGSNTFQVICTRADSSITYKYGVMSGITSNQDITVGIENNTGLIGLQISRNSYAQSFKQVKIKYPPVVTYQVRDVAVQSVINPTSAGIFGLAGDSLSVNAVLANVGNVNVTGFKASLTVLTASNQTVLTDSVDVAGMNAGTTTNISFNKKFASLTTGFYIVRVRVLLPGDQVLVNDVLQMEYNNLQKQGRLELAYENGSATGTGISWSGGTGSIGTYFVPPVLPVRIDTLKYYIAANTNNVGFRAMVYDDDGPNGTPGTILFNQLVNAPPTGTFTRVPVTGVNITSGGFYVIWTMQGESIQIATNINPPISRRSLEGFENVFAPFRNADTDDPLIRAVVFAQSIGLENTSSVVPDKFELSQNYPNPFNPVTKINFAIPKTGFVSLKVYDVLGKEIANLVSEELNAGTYSYDFNGVNFSSGIYFYRIETNGFVQTKQMVLVK